MIAILRLCLSTLLSLCLAGSILLEVLHAQLPGIPNLNCIEIESGIGPDQESRYAIRAYKSYPIKNTGISLGFGLNARLLSDPKPFLLPGSRTLRSYSNPDHLKGKDVRLWTVGLNGVISYRLFKKACITIFPELTTVSAGKAQTFTYFTDADADLFSVKQEAKPSPSGFINPLLKIKGSLQVSVNLTYQVYKNWYTGIYYSRARYEFTSYQLLSYRNDRFMKGTDFIGLTLGLGIQE